MKSKLSWIALPLLMATQAGCLGTRPYEPLRVVVWSPSVVSAQAISEFALDEDMYVTRRTANWSDVELVSKPRGTLRERIQIETRNDSLAVSYWTEVRNNAGWQRSGAVCAEYSHAREREVIRRLRALIRRKLLL